MPTFSLPNFNLRMRVWYGDVVPDDGPPDVADHAAQKYVPTKALLDITPGAWEQWVPPVYIRFPLTGVIPLGPGCQPIGYIECPSGSDQYYRIRWGEIVHQGFPNEYAVVLGEQVHATGVPVTPPAFP